MRVAVRLAALVSSLQVVEEPEHEDDEQGDGDDGREAGEDAERESDDLGQDLDREPDDDQHEDELDEGVRVEFSAIHVRVNTTRGNKAGRRQNLSGTATLKRNGPIEWCNVTSRATQDAFAPPVSSEAVLLPPRRRPGSSAPN